MDRSSYCGCKGSRSCLICEERFGLHENKPFKRSENEHRSYTYCNICNRVYRGWGIDDSMFHENHKNVESYYIPGIFVENDFIDIQEEQILMEYIDSVPWDVSQSGRRKQNYGPKCNFKKRKLKMGNFNGFPRETLFIQEKFKRYALLDKYYTIEQCSLEYEPFRGASIDPHIDDCWVWGKRIITVNLLSDSVLTLIKYKGDKKKYNLEYAPWAEVTESKTDDLIIHISMPRRSLIVLYDEARYEWEHCIFREDITERRVCIAYREFTPIYLPGGDFYESIGKEILSKNTLFSEIIANK